MTNISDLKNIADILQKAGKTEELQKIYELQQQQLDMQSEIQELKKENEALKEKLNEKEEIHFDKARGVYVKNGAEDEYFCPTCWEKDKNQIRLHRRGDDDVLYDCKVCKNYFETKKQLNSWSV